jgi:hypothetical protein
VTDQPQSPEQQAGDVPAALQPDAPTIAHPVIDPAFDLGSPPEPAPASEPPAPSEPPPSGEPSAVDEPAAPDEPPAPAPPAAWTPPYSAPDVAATDTPALDTPTTSVADRPEIAVGAAFAGGFILALILKRLGR